MITHAAAGWRIREFELVDQQPCETLMSNCLDEFTWLGPQTGYLAPFRRSLAEHETWVAEEPHVGIIGCLILIRQDAYVEHLFVAQDWRLCGIGRGLLEIARTRAGKPLLLTVDSKNHQARRAYAAMGWQPTGTPQHESDRLRIRLLSV